MLTPKNTNQFRTESNNSVPRTGDFLKKTSALILLGCVTDGWSVCPAIAADVGGDCPLTISAAPDAGETAKQAHADEGGKSFAEIVEVWPFVLALARRLDHIELRDQHESRRITTELEPRIEQARRVYAAGLQFANRMENEVQWWVFWGRVAGGLNRNQQIDVFQRLAATLLPRGGKRQRINSSLLREMWRAAASLELLPMQTKIELGDSLAGRAKSGEIGDSDFWCLTRLGARELFYGPANQVVPPTAAARWVQALLPLDRAAEAVVAIARRTGDPARDLSAAVIEQVRESVAKRADADRLAAILEGEEALDSGTLDRMFGEELPSGLVFANERAGAD